MFLLFKKDSSVGPTALKIILATSLLMPALASAQSLQPGLWKAKSSLDLNGLPLPDSENEECVTAAKAKDVKATIAKELKAKGCAITKWNLKSQKLEASLQCDNKDFKATGTLRGSVTAKKYDLSGDADGSFKSIPSSAKIKLVGQWTGPCPK